MSNRVTFGDIHRLLTSFDFERRRVEGKPWVVFEHKDSGTMFIFRPHRSNERIDSGNLASVRYQLVMNGFLTEAEFEEELDKLTRDRVGKPRKK